MELRSVIRAPAGTSLAFSNPSWKHFRWLYRFECPALTVAKAALVGGFNSTCKFKVDERRLRSRRQNHDSIRSLPSLVAMRANDGGKAMISSRAVAAMRLQPQNNSRPFAFLCDRRRKGGRGEAQGRGREEKEERGQWFEGESEGSVVPDDTCR